MGVQTIIEELFISDIANIILSYIYFRFEGDKAEWTEMSLNPNKISDVKKLLDDHFIMSEMNSVIDFLHGDIIYDSKRDYIYVYDSGGNHIYKKLTDLYTPDHINQDIANVYDFYNNEDYPKRIFETMGYEVVIGPKYFSIFQQMYIDTEKEEILRDIEYETVFIPPNNDPYKDGIYEMYYKEKRNETVILYQDQIYTITDVKHKGNSLLFILPNPTSDVTHYMCVGNRIKEFGIPKNIDRIIDYESPIGNNYVSYPYAIGENYVYNLVYDFYIPKNKWNNQNLYEEEDYKFRNGNFFSYVQKLNLL